MRGADRRAALARVGRGMGYLQFILIPVVVYGLLVGFLYFNQRSMMFQPDQQLPTPAAAGVADMAPIQVTTTDGLTHTGWYKAAQAGNPTVVYFHGNGGNLGYSGFKARGLLDAGYGVFLAGYRGYGGNPGSPSEDGLYEDARAVLNYLRENGIEAPDVVLYGESLGTGVAVRMAAEMAVVEPVAAVVLEAPYGSIVDVASGHYPFVPAGLLLKDRFESVDRVARIDAPLLVIHGEADSVVPVAHGRKLYHAAQEPKIAVWIPGALHNNLYDHGAGERVLEFLAKIQSSAKN